MDSENDAEYILYVSELVSRLFSIEPGLDPRSNSRATDITISRREIVEFLVSNGLCEGNKIEQQIDIPKWIQENSLYALACIRGLMDTDGCIFNEVHVIKEKTYAYPRISLVSKSAPMRASAFSILNDASFSPRIRGDRAVNLEKRADVIGYFSRIGTNNPKHAKRYISFRRSA